MTLPEHLSRRMKQPGFQGAVDPSLFERKSSLPRKTNWMRCPFCQNEVPKQEIFPSGQVCVGRKNFEKIFQLAKETNARFTLDKTELCKYPLVLNDDELNGQWIDGMAYYIQIDLCRKCLEKLKLRHKFRKEIQRKKKIFYNN